MAAILGEGEQKSKRRKQEKARKREQTGCKTFIHEQELKTYHPFLFISVERNILFLTLSAVELKIRLLWIRFD